MPLRPTPLLRLRARPVRSNLLASLRPPRPQSSVHVLTSLLSRNRSIATPPTAANEIIPPATPVTAPVSIIDRLPTWAKGAKPYLMLMRIDKPIGSALLFWPCAWGITLASTSIAAPVTTPAFYLSLFALGAWIMRGAGCTINDMWDRKFDMAVERTRSRPLAAGDVTPFKALVFLGGQLSAGLAVLTQLNWYSIVLGASSMGLVVIYPFMKRITYYPQIVFGMTFNWGTLLGWSAVAGVVNWTAAAPLYIGGVAWGVMYDCIYAHQVFDKKDDVTAGVKSIALRFPDTSRPLISALSATFVSSIALTGYLTGAGPLYYLISCGGTAAHLAWQCLTVNFDDPKDCWKKFVSNGWLGGVTWLGMLADYFARVGFFLG